MRTAFFLDAKGNYAKTWLLWALLIALLYFPTYRTFPYFDDTAHVEWVVAYGASIFHHPESPMFRPFERLIIGLSWHMPGNGFWLAKSSSLLFLLFKTAMMASLTKMVLGRRNTLLQFAVPVLFLIHPMHVASIIKIDTISENLASLFALAVVLLAGRLGQVPADKLGNGVVLRYAVGAGLLSLLGMLSKEAYLGMAAATPLLLAVAAMREKQSNRARYAFLTSGVVTAAAMATYFLLRNLAGYSLSGGAAGGRYQFHMGWNVIENAAASLGASLFPGSTLKLFVHFDLFYAVLAVGVALALLLMYARQYFAFAKSLTAGATRRSSEARLLLLFAIAAVASLFPGGMVNGLISENQSEATIPFVLLLALLIPAFMFRDEADSAERELGTGRGRKLAATAMLVAMAATLMATGTAEKVAAAREMSRKAYKMGDAMVQNYLDHPVSHFFLCVPPDSMTRDKYSIFSMSNGLLAETQMYRIALLHPAKPANFVPDIPQIRALSLCSMTVSDQELFVNHPTGIGDR